MNKVFKTKIHYYVQDVVNWDLCYSVDFELMDKFAFHAKTFKNDIKIHILVMSF